MADRNEQCFCVNGKAACPHPKELSCAYWHIEFGLKMARENQQRDHDALRQRMKALRQEA